MNISIVLHVVCPLLIFLLYFYGDRTTSSLCWSPCDLRGRVLGERSRVPSQTGENWTTFGTIREEGNQNSSIFLMDIDIRLYGTVWTLFATDSIGMQAIPKNKVRKVPENSRKTPFEHSSTTNIRSLWSYFSLEFRWFYHWSFLFKFIIVIVNNFRSNRSFLVLEKYSENSRMHWSSIFQNIFPITHSLSTVEEWELNIWNLSSTPNNWNTNPSTSSSQRRLISHNLTLLKP